MDLISQIEKRRTIRKYSKRVVSHTKLKRILKAGMWAPSAHNLQPWSFIVLRNKRIRNRLLKNLFKNYNQFYSGVNLLIKHSLDIMKNAPVIVLVYNTGVFSSRISKFGKKYFYPTHISEIQSVSAAIENMLLAASCLNLGMAWLTTPIFLTKEISEVIHSKDELVAVLTLGYPLEEGMILPRKPYAARVKII